MNLFNDLETKTFKSQLTPGEIIEAIRKIPATPAQTLFSRRRQRVEIRGDAIVFPLERDTINTEFVETIKRAQQLIYQLIEKDLGLTGKTWSDKESRHSEKLYKRHKKLHLAFIGTIPPTSVEEYKAKKQEQTSEKMIRANEILEEFLDQKNPLTASVKECKLNTDGHLVVRIDIHNAVALFNCRQKLGSLFGGAYNRYDDPEKQKTLAAVIGVVDHEKLSSSARIELEKILKNLEEQLKKIGEISLVNIEWVDYEKRTLSPGSRLSVRQYHRRDMFKSSGTVPDQDSKSECRVTGIQKDQENNSISLSIQEGSTLTGSSESAGILTGSKRLSLFSQSKPVPFKKEWGCLTM